MNKLLKTVLMLKGAEAGKQSILIIKSQSIK